MDYPKMSRVSVDSAHTLTEGVETLQINGLSQDIWSNFGLPLKTRDGRRRPWRTLTYTHYVQRD